MGFIYAFWHNQPFKKIQIFDLTQNKTEFDSPALGHHTNFKIRYYYKLKPAFL